MKLVLRPQPDLQTLGANVVVAAIYVVGALLGLRFASQPDNVSPIWPLAGVLVGLMVRWGGRIWPGILIGELVISGVYHAPLAQALIVAIGSTVEIVVCTALVYGIVHHPPTVDRLGNILALVVGAVIGAGCGATMGTLAFLVSDTSGGVASGVTWVHWWVGDSIGIVALAPLFLTYPPLTRYSRRQLIEGVLLLLTLMLLTYLVFGARLSFAYLIIPLITWSVVRFGSFGGAISVPLVALIAILRTVSGSGPFVQETLESSLLFLQIFVAALAVSTLIFSAITAERNYAASINRIAAAIGQRTERHDGDVLRDMLAVMLPTIGDWGMLWLNDGGAHELRYVSVERAGRAANDSADARIAWLRPQLQLAAERGVALILDDLPRAALAATADLPRSLVVVPLVVNGSAIGALAVGIAHTWRFYQPIDLALIDDLARRIAVGIKNATLLRSMQLALAEREESLGLLNLLIEHVPVPFALLDRELRFVRVNRTLAQLNGISMTDHIGRSLEELLPLGSATAGLLRRVLETEEPLVNYDLPNSGRVGPSALLLSAYPIPRSGEVVGVGVLIVDLTEKRSLEARLSQAQRLESIGLLAGGIAHDFNNLLTVISSCAALLLEDLPVDHPSRRDAHDIADAAQRGRKLTTHLLAVARRQQLLPQTVDVARQVADTVLLMRRLITPQTAIVSDIADDLPLVTIDPTQFEQVLLNLLINARDAIVASGTITVRAARATLDDAAPLPDLPAGVYVSLSVADTGTGIPQELHQRIFEPFFTTKQGLGNGLGLATSYGIIRQSGGSIMLESELGRGTMFTIYLPAAETLPSA